MEAIKEKIENNCRDIFEIKTDIKEIKNELKNKVSYKNFWYVFGSLVTILITVLGFIYNKINDTYRETVITKQSVSKIEGKLEPYKIEFKD